MASARASPQSNHSDSIAFHFRTRCWTEFCAPRAEGDLIGRVTELAKEHPSVPRHAINGDEYFSPTEMGKAHDDIVKAAGTAAAVFQ